MNFGKHAPIMDADATTAPVRGEVNPRISDLAGLILRPNSPLMLCNQTQPLIKIFQNYPYNPGLLKNSVELEILV